MVDFDKSLEFFIEQSSVSSNKLLPNSDWELVTDFFITLQDANIARLTRFSWVLIIKEAFKKD